jgi:hypothetical protein
MRSRGRLPNDGLVAGSIYDGFSRGCRRHGLAFEMRVAVSVIAANSSPLP